MPNEEKVAEEKKLEERMTALEGWVSTAEPRLVAIEKQGKSTSVQVRKDTKRVDRMQDNWKAFFKTCVSQVPLLGKKFGQMCLLFAATFAATTALGEDPQWRPWEASVWGSFTVQGNDSTKKTTVTADALVISNSVYVGGIVTNAGHMALSSGLEVTGGQTNTGNLTVTGTAAVNGNATIGDNKVGDSHVLNGNTELKGTFTLSSTNLTYTNTMDSTAVGTVMIGRPTSGTVLLTSKDDTGDAALTVAAGGSGATTIGDADSATTITGTSVGLLKGTTVGSLAAIVASDTTALLVNGPYTFTADASHTVWTQALTTAYGDGVVGVPLVTPTESGNTWYVNANASNSVQVTATADKDMLMIVVGVRP